MKSKNFWKWAGDFCNFQKHLNEQFDVIIITSYGVDIMGICSDIKGFDQLLIDHSRFAIHYR